MQYDIKLREHNKKPYQDIVRDMQKKKGGLFSFVIRLNAGNIVDYVTQETVIYKD